MPLESRLCFEVSINQNSLNKKVIGVCQTCLFDHHGRMLQGPVTMNLWPFYSLEPRISCMGQFQHVSPVPFAQLTVSILHPTPILWSLATVYPEVTSSPPLPLPGKSFHRFFNLFGNLTDKPSDISLSS